MDPCSMLVLIGSLFLSDRRELLRYVMIRFQYFWRECKTSSPTPAPQLASEPLHYNHRSLHRNLSVDSSRSFGTVTESLVEAQLNSLRKETQEITHGCEDEARNMMDEVN